MATVRTYSIRSLRSDQGVPIIKCSGPVILEIPDVITDEYRAFAARAVQYPSAEVDVIEHSGTVTITNDANAGQRDWFLQLQNDTPTVIWEVAIPTTSLIASKVCTVSIIPGALSTVTDLGGTGFVVVLPSPTLVVPGGEIRMYDKATVSGGDTAVGYWHFRLRLSRFRVRWGGVERILGPGRHELNTKLGDELKIIAPSSTDLTNIEDTHSIKVIE